jgi:hypothetical protein
MLTRSLSAKATSRAANEVYQLVDQRIAQFSHPRKRAFQTQPRPQQDPISFLELLNLARLEPRPPKPNQIQPMSAARHAVRHYERQTVLHDFGVATDHSKPAQMAKLMDHDTSGNENSVVDFHVTCQRNVVCNDHPIAQPAVVCDVRASHYETIRTDDRFGFRFGAAMNCNPLAKRVRSADAKVAFALFEAEILRFAAEDRAFVNDIVSTKSSKPFYHGVRANFAGVADICARLDHGIRSDADSGAKACGRIDDGCGMNAHRLELEARDSEVLQQA